MKTRLHIAQKTRAATYGLLLGVLFACGAPVKKADEVSDIFDSSASLATKVGNLCTNLSRRQTEPRLTSGSLVGEACGRQVGAFAQNLNMNADLRFAAVRSDGKRFSTNTGGVTTADNPTLKLETRTEVWLNRSLLSIVRTLLPMLRDKSNNLFAQKQPGQGTGDQAKFTIKMIGSPQFDKTNFALHLEFDLVSTKADNGKVYVHNNFVVDAMLIDNKYGAATIRTKTPAATSADSIIKEGEFLVFIVPHAKDIYLNILTSLTLFSFGVDTAMEDQVLKTISDGLKAIPTFIKDAEAKAKAGSP